MFTPNFTITQKILNDLTQVERLYGQLEGIKIPKSLELNVNRDNLIRSTYISNSIEGNPLSLPEVTNLLLGDRLPVNRDEKEVKNYFDILKNIDQFVGRPLSLDLICEIHQQLMTGVRDDIAGQIRDEGVIVGIKKWIDGKQVTVIKHKPPVHTRIEISKYLIELMTWLDQATNILPIIKAGVFHHQYVYLHPFEDGNGRTCRLLTALIFLKHNYHINKYFVIDDYYDVDKLAYSDMLHSADNGDKTTWLEYFVEGIKYSLQSSLSKIQSNLVVENISNRLTTREKEVYEFVKLHNQVTSADLVTEQHITRQQAHKLLTALVEKGYLDKSGSTKSSYYEVKK